MTFLESLLLGVFQGITEFLPVSSSGHLVLAEHYFELNATELILFDAVLHGGSLFSLIVLFWKEITSFFGVLFHPKSAPKKDRNLLLYVILGTIPVGAIGFLLRDFFDPFRHPIPVAICFLFSALLFFFAEKYPLKKEKKLSFPKVLFIALMQVVSLLPGVSRSGTVTAATMLTGVSRGKATRFAFLLGMPVIGAAFLLSLYEIFSGSITVPVSYTLLVVGFLSSAISGYIMARFLLRFFQTHSLNIFGVYLVVLAGIILGKELLF